jgi:hypothetical protein
MDSPPQLAFDDNAIASVIDLAVRGLEARFTSDRILVLIVWPKRAHEIEARSSGWCELGRLSDPTGRFRWLILWNPERAEGRLLRSFARAARGPLGEILQPE